MLDTTILILLSFLLAFAIWGIINVKISLPVKILYAILLLSFSLISYLIDTNSTFTNVNHTAIDYVFWLIVIAGIPFIIPPLRKRIISTPFFKTMKKTLPPISETEMIALKAGDVWWDKELFSGSPDWKVLEKVKRIDLSKEEQNFLDNEVETLCEMVEAHKVRHNNDFSPKVWRYIKDNNFFGMIIPKKYGGLGFSHTAHSLVVTKLATRCGALSVTVMVPNSLGPSELLLKYGTSEQKDKYLTSLATGKEVPCFSLTSTYAGSDAGSIIDNGIVCEKKFGNKKVLGFKLNWEKRYITLAPVATIIGLAFKAYDPDGLLPANHPLYGKRDLGITCALIPRNTKGVEIGKRHNPLGSGFMNGPNSGKDVFIPMNYIIGDIDMIGEGWRMLMECLSIGRGISLPATGNAANQSSLMVTSAYAQVREQFGIPIAKFEAIAQKLGIMLINAYKAKANCTLTTNALDANLVPATISAIIKYRNTYSSRICLENAMEIHAGKAIIAGPKNYILDGYLSVPIGITVEGANILTRSLMVFGQGVTRCHPYLFDEMEALYNEDYQSGLDKFDKVFFNHLSFSFKNIAKLFAIRLQFKPKSNFGSNSTRKGYDQLALHSLQFATLTDLALLFIGGNLKRKGIISSQFADALSCLYEITAALNYYDNLENKDDKMQLVMQSVVLYTSNEFEQAITNIIDNLPVNKFIKKSLSLLIIGLSQKHPPLANKQIIKLADISNDLKWLRENISKDVYISPKTNDPINELKQAYEISKECYQIKNKLKKNNIKYIPFESYEKFLNRMVEEKNLEQEEADKLLKYRNQIFNVMSVDEYEEDEIGEAKV